MTTTSDLVTSEFVQHGAYRTHVSRAGSGPDVLLLHGSGPGVSALANWAMTMSSELAEHFTLIAPDIAGFGQTEVEGDLPVRQSDRIAHIADLLGALGLRDVRVVGNSMGGGIALGLASKHPDLVSRLVLMGSSGVSFPLTPEIDELYGYEPSVPAMRRIFELMAYDTSGVSDELIEMRYEASKDPAVYEPYAAMFAAPRQRHIDDQALGDAELAKIDVPTLCIHGVFDRIVPIDVTSLHLVRVMPNADLLALGRCGHWSQVERADTFRRAVREFFETPAP